MTFSYFPKIFINKEYEVSLNCTVNTVVDCGANIGLASLFFLSKFKKARIVAIEPERRNFDMLVRNLQSFQEVTCVNRGIWPLKVPLQILDNGRGDLGFITKPSELNNKNVVDSITIADILADYHLGEIDILKIDIEGSEEQLFFYNPEVWLNKTKIIFCEIHENMKPGLSERIIKQLSPHFTYFIHGEYHVFQRRDERFFKDKIVKESSIPFDD